MVKAACVSWKHFALAAAAIGGAIALGFSVFRMHPQHTIID